MSGHTRSPRRKAAALSRLWAMSLVIAPLLLHGSTSAAGSTGVPAGLQAELLSKLAAYDRNYEARAAGKAHVLIVSKAGEPRSTLHAAVMRSELGKLERIGGLPHRETTMTYEDAGALARRCKSESVDIVYVTPGLEDEVSAIHKALSGLDVLSVSAIPESVPEGIVLGFELVSGKPKILLNLPQARRQNVHFKADVLKLMKVYR